MMSGLVFVRGVSAGWLDARSVYRSLCTRALASRERMELTRLAPVCDRDRSRCASPPKTHAMKCRPIVQPGCVAWVGSWWALSGGTFVARLALMQILTSLVPSRGVSSGDRAGTSAFLAAYTPRGTRCACAGA